MSRVMLMLKSGGVHGATALAWLSQHNLEMA
jgi:hypothetical protein